MIISCQHIKKYHSTNLVLADVTLEVDQGERIGLIGRNGSGKSTLLELIAGTAPPDEGTISIQKGAKIGYLRQIPAEREQATVYEVLADGFREVVATHAQLVDLEGRLASPLPEAEMAKLLKQYAELQERYQHAGGFEMDARIQTVANGLRIPQAQFGRPFASLSGGEKTKVALAALLIERPTVLLLDEPTNHLDTAGIEWLENFLREYDGACLVVSHDRYFLDRVVTKITELEDGESVLYHTNYSGYVQEKEARLLQQFAEYKDQQKRIKQMKETIKELHEWGRLGGNEKFFRRAASMQKALDRMEKLKRPVMERQAAEFNLQPAERSGQEALVIEDLTKRFGDRVVLDGVNGLLRWGEKVVLVGQNGAGKSTLFKLLLGQERPDGGAVRLGARVSVGYLAQEDEPDSAKTVLEHFCEEAKVETGEGRNLLARYLFYGADVFQTLDQLSGGEWSRLRLALLMHAKPNLLLLDEPTNHLDIDSREALEEALAEFPGTVLAISHDRYFINRLAESVWELDDGQLTRYLGNYDDYKEKRPGTPTATKQETTVPAPKPARERDRRTSERAKAQLEQAIANTEAQLAALEASLAEAEGESDFIKLGQLWSERDTLTARLNNLLEEWVGAAE